MIIRKLQPNDASKLLIFLKQLDSEQDFMMYEARERKTSLEEMSSYIENINNSGSLILAAEADNSIVGFLTAEKGFVKRIQHSAYIVTGIIKDYWGKGIGTRLFEELDKWAVNNQITRLELTVMCNNKAAIALYKKMGFVIEGIKKNSIIINSHYIDEYYMAKLLI